jgi:cyclase
MKENMFYGAGSIIFKRAAELRANPTPMEEHLWHFLSKNQLGLRFKRQHPISNYIADFYCHSIKLAIEIDGSVHNTELEC